MPRARVNYNKMLYKSAVSLILTEKGHTLDI